MPLKTICKIDNGNSKEQQLYYCVKHYQWNIALETPNRICSNKNTRRSQRTVYIKFQVCIIKIGKDCHYFCIGNGISWLSVLLLRHMCTSVIEIWLVDIFITCVSFVSCVHKELYFREENTLPRSKYHAQHFCSVN